MVLVEISEVSPEGETIRVHCTGQPASARDINGDGAIDGIDLTILLGHWGVCP